MAAGSGTTRGMKGTAREERAEGKGAAAVEVKAAERDPRDTPAMRQYARFKAQHPDCLLLFRIGDFYELFDEDAVTISKALGLTLTQRTAGIPMAGVPYHAVENYLRRLIEAGFRVAICEQMEDAAAAKGIVDRAVTRVLTPGTLVDETLLDEARPNRIAAVQFTGVGEDSGAVAAVVELSTGEFSLMELEGARLADELARLKPSEIVYVETADGATPARVAKLKEMTEGALTARAAWTFRMADATDALRGHFGVTTLAGFALAEGDAVIGPAGALVRYLQETQPGGDGGKALGHLRPPRRVETEKFLQIDAGSLRSLEIERTLRNGTFEGSLLWVLQRAQTPMGKRLLRHWLAFPLRDLEEIRARHRAVQEFLSDDGIFAGIGEMLGKIQDVARIAGRTGMRRATPRDVVALGRSLGDARKLAEMVSGRPAMMKVHEELKGMAEGLADLAERILGRCVEEPPAHLREGGLFKEGFDAELDAARGLQRDASTWLAEFQRKLVVETNIPSLKVGYNRVFGYYIEVTNSHAAKIPSEFVRRQTLRNAERYVTADLQEFEQKVTTAEARALEREQKLFEGMCGEIAKATPEVLKFADVVAELDVLRAFAESARKYRYVCPEMAEEPVLKVVQGRHPVLDRTLSQQFVPNDCALGGETASLALITGPNMAGKSTFIRQTALIVLMAHAGSFVPADSARIGVTDRIFTRIGAADEIHAGQSTFMVEMTETALILHHATERSLVILDEIGRGTSTLDGLALAWAIAEAIADVKCRALFATHYHEITDLADERENVTNLHVSVREWNDQIIFLHRILAGRTNRSYGIHVAKIAGLPSGTVARATELLESLAVHAGHQQTGIATKGGAGVRENEQLSLFTQYVNHPVVDELKGMRIEGMTPLEAFDALREMKAKAEGKKD
ncbi:MAG TPA: DNA mismatch repair protein MutS [Phycisphaerales bacterium]|nr:DNA mismatch repair protein MutS [Phycisphaerales bacterium]